MEENHAAAFESIANGDHHDSASTASNDYNNTHHTHANNDHGWKKVTAKRPRKKKESNAEVIKNQNKLAPASRAPTEMAFSGRWRNNRRTGWQILEAQRANVDLDDVSLERSKLRSDDEDGDNSDDEATAQNVKAGRRRRFWYYMRRHRTFDPLDQTGRQSRTAVMQFTWNLERIGRESSRQAWKKREAVDG